MKIPLIYSLSHYLLGYLSFYCKFIIIIFTFYQLLQYIFNIRFFLLNRNCFKNFKSCIKKGNNLKHTLYKLMEFFIGYIIAFIFNYIIL